MEVQSLTTPNAPPAPETAPQAPPAPASPDTSDPTVPSLAVADADAAPSLAASNAGVPDASGPSGHASTLSAVSKVLVGGTISVSYDTISNPNHVVTVFRDAHTGRTLFEVPAQILTQLAQFFDQVSGAVVDSKA